MDAELELRRRYAAVKRQAAATAANIDEYRKGKNALIQEILLVAGFTEAEKAELARLLSRFAESWPRS